VAAGLTDKLTTVHTCSRAQVPLHWALLLELLRPLGMAVGVLEDQPGVAEQLKVGLAVVVCQAPAHKARMAEGQAPHSPPAVKAVQTTSTMAAQSRISSAAMVVVLVLDCTLPMKPTLEVVVATLEVVAAHARQVVEVAAATMCPPAPSTSLTAA